MIELVDFNETYMKDQKEKKKTRRRGGKKSSAPISKQSIDNITEATEEEKIKEFTKVKTSEKEDKSSSKGNVTKTSENKEKSEDKDSKQEN